MFNKRTSLQDWQFYRVFNGLGCLMRIKGNLSILVHSLKNYNLCTATEFHHLNRALYHIQKLLINYKENSSKIKPKGKIKMTRTEIEKHKAEILKMNHLEMAKFYRFAPAGHFYFGFELWRTFETRFKKLGGMTTKISKQIGWER